MARCTAWRLAGSLILAASIAYAAAVITLDEKAALALLRATAAALALAAGWAFSRLAWLQCPAARRSVSLLREVSRLEHR